MTDQSTAQTTELFSTSQKTLEAAQDTLANFLETANVERVYGEPIQHGEVLILPAAEVLVGLGFGVGSGGGQGSGGGEEEGEGTGAGAGGGGGGRTLSRPVAVVVAAPEGVRVEPIIDPTKIALAALTAGGFVFATMLRLTSPRRAMRALQRD